MSDVTRQIDESHEHRDTTVVDAALRRGRLAVAMRRRELEEARDLQRFLYASDQRLRRFNGGSNLADRAAIAVRLGDAVNVAAMHEHAALAIVRFVAAQIRGGAIDRDDPITQIDLSTWRLIARSAVDGGHAYLALTNV